MRDLLWPPGEGDDHAAEIARFFEGDALVSCPGGLATAVFVLDRGDGRLGGFIETGLRPFADGCDTRPVGYVEGWYVDEDLRRAGHGAALIAAAESWAVAQGCTEMASDCDLDNEVSLHAHLALGYAESERVIKLCKKIGPPANPRSR
jgi:aminoglycoside 6'-N-acetyltransferase I